MPPLVARINDLLQQLSDLNQEIALMSPDESTLAAIKAQAEQLRAQIEQVTAQIQAADREGVGVYKSDAEYDGDLSLRIEGLQKEIEALDEAWFQGQAGADQLAKEKRAQLQHMLGHKRDRDGLQQMIEAERQKAALAADQIDQLLMGGR